MPSPSSTQEFMVFHGTVIHSLSPSDLEINENAVVVVNVATGKIVLMERKVDKLNEFLSGLSLLENKQYNVNVLKKDQFILPGFIDTHAHAPQFSYAATGMDLPLLDWLDTYTFPKEAEYAESEHAQNVYSKVVDRFLSCGTTTCSWFATIHLEASKILTDVIEEKGQRAYIGKVNMDQNSPDYYIEKTESSVSDTRTFIEYVQAKNNELLTPIITPRFAISCTSPLLKALGDLAKEYQVPIQSHLCENVAEIEFTQSLFPNSVNYTAVYDDHGLLNDKTIMAHCVHMTEDELKLIKEREAGVSHCPNSNFNLQSGVADIRHYLDLDIKCSLGTDVAGGFATSILDAMRSAFTASNTIGILKSQYGNRSPKPYKALDAKELIYLATLGGAKVVGMEDKIGNFKVGKDFDALVVDASDNGPVRLFRHDGAWETLQKFLFTGDERCLSHVYVRGRRVAGWKQ
ncbi:hypothetical protein K450DRAFT_226702 [Umbelopsis ramanniana AG]|uniref:Guanine deaminase n=1 Tax=Umbelopsis ramanniana AG TaxID=1314678 RepID=A0AAD5EFX3_UMBRA|nr:uncharacterized protein K450DRAFT_226702 [Umbelopsis ramanniana AG]KAI8582744.1 hypothetical protein K450DRAFT_226702 [Umbelopsis ramanniana AG]